ncbi:ATP-binding response regulator [Ramlibacter humi]|uniref:histidine kinase n=1 Tax=Ramlibacter humi TaxID=2530451 RepID=A0A4Z0BPC9_9BURK|nr:hybrid sensor histidine kinase/response regulator [Ramlibacter humi]TFZ00118.1 response regulator [Ramlibacter humi]
MPPTASAAHALLRAPLQLLAYVTGASAKELPASVQRVQLEFLLRRVTPMRLLVVFPFAGVMCGLFYRRTGSPWILAWTALVFALTFYTWHYWRQRETRPLPPDEGLARELSRRTRLILAHGIAWGLAPWMLKPGHDLAYGALLSTYMMGAVSTAAAMLPSHRQTVAAYCLPAGLGLVLADFWSGGVGWVFGLAMALYLAVCLRWTFHQADLLAESLTVRFEKEELARQLAEQVALVEAAQREKSRFFAAASHDLRQPVHAISLFTSVLARSQFPASAGETVERLRHSVRMLSGSLDTMLDVSKLDAGAIQPRLQQVSVHQLFLSLQTTYADRASAKGVQLRVRAPGDLGVLSDPQLLERLLGNLVDNAIKYTHAGGILVAARAAPGRGVLCFEVVDTGIGIAPEHREKIFDEFFQVDNPQRDRSFGLGIGLAVVKRLSGLLRHPVELRSRPGRGTRFRVWVPRDRTLHAGGVAHDAHAEAGLAEPARLPRSVLVIDDEADNRDALSALLSSYGCTVHCAADTEDAERQLRTHRVDTVVSDFRLPGPHSGLDFLLAVRARMPSVRTLLVTGETAPERIATIKATGMPCLYKPVAAEKLLAALSS